MKQTFFIIATLFFLCSCSEKETIISGTIIGNEDKVIYSNPKGGTCFSGFRDTVSVDENGNFELKLTLKQPSFVELWTSQTGKGVKLLLEEGKKYHILINVENDNIPEISGDNEDGQRLYSSLPNPSFMSQQNRELQKENSIAVISEKIQEMKSEELKQFQKMLDESKISKSFFELIKIDRDCYYASLESRIIQIKIYGSTPNEKGEYILDNGENLLESLDKIYTQYPPNKSDFLISSFSPEYIEFFIKDYVTIQENYNMEKLMDLYEKGQLHTFYIDLSKKYIDGRLLEFFQASYIYKASIQKRFEKELISLFEQFEKDYPQSEYTKYMKPYIDEIIDYHAKIEMDYGDEISFIEQFDNINTFKKLVSSLAGKKIYIDIWATWCGPCKREFQHSEELKKVLKENDTQMLYVSIDTEEKDSHWREMIKYYNLEGKHIRTNKKLLEELVTMYDEKSKSISIPWYILIDEEGNIIKKHAKRPSEIISGGNIFD
ncbi:thiol-disulfide isomerase/thioredoxin [Dysgonomonadaceae bacterium PH5-43]|nr:thiol-disulfide isomerase/thioredoxin [Dysgonomonadaceae bacterium PH5-43]